LEYNASMAKRERSSAKPLEPSRGVAASAEKSIISIRMPVEVLKFIEDESRARAAALGLKGADLENAINITAQINRTLDSLRSWFSLPAIVAEAAEKDRAALGLPALRGHREERARLRPRGLSAREGLWRQALIGTCVAALTEARVRLARQPGGPPLRPARCVAAVRRTGNGATRGAAYHASFYRGIMAGDYPPLLRSAIPWSRRLLRQERLHSRRLEALELLAGSDLGGPRAHRGEPRVERRVIHLAPERCLGHNRPDVLSDVLQRLHVGVDAEAVELLLDSQPRFRRAEPGEHRVLLRLQVADLDLNLLQRRLRRLGLVHGRVQIGPYLDDLP